MTEGGQRHTGRGPQYHGEADAGEEHGPHHRQRMSQVHGQRQQDGRQQQHQQADAQGASRSHPGDEARRQEAGQDVERRIGGEPVAEPVHVQTQLHHQLYRRRRDIGQDHRHRQHAERRVEQEARGAQHRAVARPADERAAAAGLLRAGLRHPPQQPAADDDRITGHKPEVRRPARLGGEPATEQGRQGGNEADGAVQVGDHLAALLGAIAVTHHREGGHRGGTGTEALQHPRQHQLTQAGGKAGCQGAQPVEQHAPQRDGFAAIAVGERPHQQLAQSHAEQEPGDGALHQGHLGSQLLGHLRDGRQIDVDGQRAEQHQEYKQKNQWHQSPQGLGGKSIGARVY